MTQEKVGEPLTGHVGVVHAVAFNHDGTLVATAALDGAVHVWNVGRVASEFLKNVLR